VIFLDPKLAAAVVIARDDRILLGRRGPHTRNPGTWSFPAGFVDRGDEVEAAAMREVREETGLTVTLSPILDLISHEGDTTVLAVYAATSIIGQERAGDDLVELAWFPIDTLPILGFDHDGRIVTTWRHWRAARAIL
jgi:8-oxo-dGTP pyrophosphatase MutT (NUDIX family)